MNESVKQSIAVIGLGKLGAPMAAAMAFRGFKVTGVDLDAKAVTAINERRPHIREARLGECLAAAGDRISATTDGAAAVAAADITFIIVPTPSGPDGAFSMDRVLAAAKDIGHGIARHPGYPVIVLSSTVMPGDTEGKLRSRLEEVSGRTCGDGFGLCYSPEFIALGSVIDNLLNPDFVLIGESDRRSGDILESFFARFCENDAPVSRLRIVNAELAKIGVNTFVTTKISYANMLAEICAALPGADVDEVTGAIGLDRRIGGKYLRGGASFGGPCFPRDNRALGTFARALGVEPLIAEASDAMNRRHADILVNTVKARLRPGGRVAVLGLAYKPGTPVVDESPSLILIDALRREGIAVVAFDPLVTEGSSSVLGEPLDIAESLDACVRNADVVVIMTPADDWRAMQADWLRPDRQTTVIDCWRVLDRNAVSDSAEYVPLGVGPDRVSRSEEGEVNGT